jgi:hypothetical protein
MTHPRAPQGPLYDLRSPLGVPPAALAQQAASLASPLQPKAHRESTPDRDRATTGGGATGGGASPAQAAASPGAVAFVGGSAGGAHGLAPPESLLAYQRFLQVSHGTHSTQGTPQHAKHAPAGAGLLWLPPPPPASFAPTTPPPRGQKQVPAPTLGLSVWPVPAGAPGSALPGGQPGALDQHGAV